jgi:hypothetical protein
MTGLWQYRFRQQAPWGTLHSQGCLACREGLVLGASRTAGRKLIVVDAAQDALNLSCPEYDPGQSNRAPLRARAARRPPPRGE